MDEVNQKALRTLGELIPEAVVTAEVVSKIDKLEELLKNCRVYMERTSGGTRSLKTELKYLNLDPNSYQHLPEEEDNVDDVYYGIEKGFDFLITAPISDLIAKASRSKSMTATS